jgi:hypothetical protein
VGRFTLLKGAGVEKFTSFKRDGGGKIHLVQVGAG